MRGFSLYKVPRSCRALYQGVGCTMFPTCIYVYIHKVCSHIPILPYFITYIKCGLVNRSVIMHQLCTIQWTLCHTPHPNPLSNPCHLTSYLPALSLSPPLPPPNAVGYQCVAFNREVTLEKKGQLPPVVKVDNKVSSACCNIAGHCCASGQCGYNLQWFVEAIYCGIVVDFA